MIEVQLRGLEFFLKEQVCSPHDTDLKLTYIKPGVVEVSCQYEGYALILAGILSKKKNIARLYELGYTDLIIKFGNRVVAIAEGFNPPESNQTLAA